jgi:hypothetical protein
MLLSYRIEGYAIASSDGMIADAEGMMPDTLKLEADQRFFEDEMDRVDAVVHGRRSHEGHPNSHIRRRMVLTRQIAAIAPDPDNPNSLLWNACGAPLERACGALGLKSGIVAVLGGPETYRMFLEVGYDAFHLTRAGNVKLPGGMPVFSQTRPGQSPEDVLAEFGLAPGPTRVLDVVNAVTLVSWRPKGSL